MGFQESSLFFYTSILMVESQSSECSHCCGVSCGTAQHVYVKKENQHKNSRDSQKINTFPWETADWLIGAVGHRSDTKQSLYKWYTGKKQREAFGNPTTGDSYGTETHKIRSSDSQIQKTCTRRELWMVQRPLCFFYIIQWMSVKDLFHHRLIIGGGGNRSVLTFKEWTSVSYRCLKRAW